MQPKKSSGRAPARGTTPLILAVENGHFELAVALLEAGADPNDQRSGFTALHTLTWVRKPNRGDEESGDPAPIGSGTLTSLQLVEKLVEHGADVNARLKRGASGRGVLSRRGATPFLLAAMTADVPYMKTLVKLGADPRLPNAQHCTPLMAAAGVGCLAPGEEAGTEDEAIEAVKLALELGNDVNAVDDNGETAMHGAAYKSFPRIVQLLADKGAEDRGLEPQEQVRVDAVVDRGRPQARQLQAFAGDHRRPSSRDARRGPIAAECHADRGPQGLFIGRGGEAYALAKPSLASGAALFFVRRPDCRFRFDSPASTAAVRIRPRKWPGAISISSRNRRAIGEGWRKPCSHDRIVIGLTANN